MPTATIVSTWKDTQNAYMAVSVVEGPVINGKQSNTEYIGKVPLSQIQGLTNAQIKAALVAAVQAERNRSLALSQPQQTDLGITGTVTL